MDNYEDGVMSRRDMIERIFRITGSMAVTAGLLLELGVKPAYADPLASVTFQAPPATDPDEPLHRGARRSGADHRGHHLPGRGRGHADGLPGPPAGRRALPGGAGAATRTPAPPSTSGTSPGASPRTATSRCTSTCWAGSAGRTPSPRTSAAPSLSAPGRAELFVVDWQSAMNYLRRQPYVIDRFGMTGYCFGGGVTWNVAIKDPSLRAAAPYYGRSAYIEETGNVRAAVLGVYAANDMGINSSIDTVREQLEAAGRTYRINVYPDAAARLLQRHPPDLLRRVRRRPPPGGTPWPGSTPTCGQGASRAPATAMRWRSSRWRWRRSSGAPQAVSPRGLLVLPGSPVSSGQGEAGGPAGADSTASPGARRPCSRRTPSPSGRPPAAWPAAGPE